MVTIPLKYGSTVLSSSFLHESAAMTVNVRSMVVLRVLKLIIFDLVIQTCKYAHFNLKNRYLCANTLPVCHMYKNIFRVLSVLLVLSLFISCAEKERYVTFSGYAQGGTYAVKANLKGVDVRPDEIAVRIDSLLKTIDRSLSGYNRNSILSRFNAGDAVIPDSLFLDIYARAFEIYDVTEGCVDPASAPLFDMWGFGFNSENHPSDEKVKEALAGCGMDRLKRNMDEALSEDGKLVPEYLLATGISGPAPKLNYNAIAQGYSCDVVADYLYSIGVKDMMVDIGEIFCDGVNPTGKPWTIGIDRPVDGNNNPGADLQEIFHVPDGPHGVVTSGNYRKFYLRDGRKYSHSIDPRTGFPVQHNLLSATVIAPDATMADAYATYCMVIGLEDSKEFISSKPELEACLIYDEDGEMKSWCSEGFVLVTSGK